MFHHAVANYDNRVTTYFIMERPKTIFQNQNMMTHVTVCTLTSQEIGLLSKPKVSVTNIEENVKTPQQFVKKILKI